MLSLGEKIHRKRLNRNLTLVQLAKLTKVTAVTIHNIERNLYEPKVSTLIDLSKALNIPLSYFIDLGPDGLFLRVREGRRSKRGISKVIKLPDIKRLELPSGSESTISRDPSRFVAFHLLFGRIKASMGEQETQLITGDNFYAELLDELKFIAKTESFGILIYYPEALPKREDL
ncbi:MAG: helix-turn-helix transcriptional regulator [Candidatus Hatepunaea meridiana]|nr:helix-turn-helix transcriptional regulator [Candidatus Hatepunaea meridiana]